jgi:hypothetical protein
MLVNGNDFIWITFTHLLIAQFVVEIVFYIFFRVYLVPRANDVSRRQSQPYRDYPITRRHILFTRILQRIEDRCKQTNKDFGVEFSLFLSRWFHDSPDQPLDDGTFPIHFWKEELDLFFAWAFFDKHFGELDPVEQKELDHFYDILQSRHGIVYPRFKSRDPTSAPYGRPMFVQPRCMTLEPVDPLHRPFFIYILAWLGKVASHIILRLSGFRCYVARDENMSPNQTSPGKLVYWFRPARCNGHSPQQQETILFFHGIAPAGFLLYIPLLYNTICNHAFGGYSKNIILFLNDPITCTISFRAMNEEATLCCIRYILQRHLSFKWSNPGTNSNHQEGCKLSLIGHSFGSCQVSWLLYCPSIRPHVGRVVLLDPVCILLSEPDVMLNFLYNRSSNSFWSKNSANHVLKSIPHDTRRSSLRKLLIRLVASSELFTEHYLRRHFSWYNSELWLDDVPEDIELYIYLSEMDDIINAGKIKEEIQLTQVRRPNKNSHIKWACWSNVGHGSCLNSPRLWNEIVNSWQESTHNKQD